MTPRVQDVVEQPVAVDRDLVAGGTWARHRRALRLAELLPLALVPLHCWRLDLSRALAGSPVCISRVAGRGACSSLIRKLAKIRCMCQNSEHGHSRAYSYTVIIQQPTCTVCDKGAN
eukprot:COSAG06_NODE_2455_length_6849_cov_5.464148_2_plen_117_part_00